MQPQRFEFGDQPWPAGCGVLQVYALVDLAANPELAELVDQAQTAMHGAPVTLVDDDVLHVTLDVVAGVTAQQVPPADREQLAGALRARLADVPAYQGFAGSPIAYVSGPILDISPAGPLVRVQHEVRDVLRAVRGEAACTWRQAKPHLSLGYCHTAADSDPWARRLRRIDPNHAPLAITSVAVVEVQPDEDTKRLEWTVVESVALGGAALPETAAR